MLLPYRAENLLPLIHVRDAARAPGRRTEGTQQNGVTSDRNTLHDRRIATTLRNRCVAGYLYIRAATQHLPNLYRLGRPGVAPK
jgi:hypothetical protein